MSGKKVKLKSVGKKGQIEKCQWELPGPVAQSSGAPLGSVIFRYTSMPPPTCTPFPQTTQLFYKISQSLFQLHKLQSVHENFPSTILDIKKHPWHFTS